MKSAIRTRKNETIELLGDRQKELLYMGQYMAMLARKEKLATLKLTG